LFFFADYWLSMWFAKSTGKHEHIADSTFVTVYAIAVALFTVGILTRGILFTFTAIKKSLNLHEVMFKAVINARMAFFDSTPIGRILNAFARHMYAVDAQLADSLMQLLQYTPLCLGAIILMIVVMHHTLYVFIVAALVVALLLMFLGNIENKLRNQESITKSSIFSHLTATLEGLFSIRAYMCQQRFVNLFNEKCDENHVYLYRMVDIKRWAAFYLDVISSFIIYFTIVTVVEFRNDYPASTSGLVISNVLQLLVFLQWTIRMFDEVQEKMSSVKQVSYYGNCVQQEPPSIIENNRPSQDWPQSGNIKFSNVVLKYQEFGVAVLKGISINIKPKEKIGIVGRTGSGKSTLLISLLRIVEAAEGKVIIDGIDIAEIGLRDLRSKIAIIPQEPILFVGTVRNNIDLFSKSTDEEIWQALDSVNLGEFVRKMDKGLETPVIGK
jgi:ABC-type multidrug transport system fused ATPase/permease subunit